MSDRQAEQSVRYDRDKVLASIDLATLATRLLGEPHPRLHTWRCPNPQHHQTGRTPPLTVFEGVRTQRWHCHGCGQGGTAVDLVTAAGHAAGFREALEWLARHSDRLTHGSPGKRIRRPPLASPSRTTIQQLNAYAGACVEHLNSRGGRPVLRWLTETRAIPHDVLDHAGVGADPGPRRLSRPDGVPRLYNAAVFPIRQIDNVVFSLSRPIHRAPDMPKWMTTAAHLAPNPRLALFDPPKPRPAGPIIVTEGLLDALSALAAGYPTATLLSPSSVNGTVADRIASLHLPILIATDNDQAGRNAHAKLRRLLTERDASVSGLHIPERFNDLNDWHTAARDQWSDVIHKCGQLVRSRVNQLKDTAPSLA